MYHFMKKLSLKFLSAALMLFVFAALNIAHAAEITLDKDGVFDEKIGRLTTDTTQKDLVRNNSFEVGFEGWSPRTFKGSDNINWEIDNDISYHGNRSLKLFNGAGIDSETIYIRPFRKYTISAYMRTDNPGLGAAIVFCDVSWKGISNAHIHVGKEWKRYTLVGKLPFSSQNGYRIIIGSLGKGTLWVDSVQVEEGGLTDYKPGQDLEIGILSDRLGNVFYPGKDVKFKVLIRNNTPEDKNLKMSFELQNYYLDTVAKESRTISAPSQVNKEKK